MIIVDNKDGENEGDVCIAAQFCTAETIDLMATHARGLIKVPMTGERLDALKIPMMTGDNTAPLRSAFTLSVSTCAKG